MLEFLLALALFALASQCLAATAAALGIPSVAVTLIGALL